MQNIASRKTDETVQGNTSIKIIKAKKVDFSINNRKVEKKTNQELGAKSICHRVIYYSVYEEKLRRLID